MPLPAIGKMVLGSLADSSGSIFGQLLANHFNKREAERQRTWQEDMFERSNAYDQEMWHMQNRYNEGQLQEQRRWDLDMWNRQNTYNSPEQQMARFKSAGLNPNLIYGQGSPGNAGALTTQRTTADRLSANSYGSYQRAQLDNVMRGVRLFSDFQNLQKEQATTDLLKKQGQIAQQEAILKGQQSMLTAMQTKKLGFDYGLSKDLRANTIEQAQANLERLQQGNILLSKDITNRGLDNAIKELDRNLKEKGIQPSDNVFLRMMMQHDWLLNKLPSWNEIQKTLSKPTGQPYGQMFNLLKNYLQ